jgi:hypothetical protein
MVEVGVAVAVAAALARVHSVRIFLQHSPLLKYVNLSRVTIKLCTPRPYLRSGCFGGRETKEIYSNRSVYYSLIQDIYSSMLLLQAGSRKSLVILQISK